ncbi:MAG: T9SS type A sorting domain-containing protein, partial [Muribaculaceae bacterium]|nr:T9SS type A sorting domain-containing protein [Muribaculaceae bacterium]
MSRIRNILLAAALTLAGTSTAFAAADASLNEPQSTSSTVQVRYGSVELTVNGSEPVTFQIFAITGQQVKSVTVPGASTTKVELPKGVYIVRG